MAETKKETKKTTETTKKTTKKTAPKKETVKEEKVVVEEVKNEKVNDEKETMMGISKNAELILVYIFSIIGLIFSIMKDEKVSKNMKFHYNQAATIWIVNMIVNLISRFSINAFDFINFICLPINIVLFVFTIIALVKACNGEKYEIPLINNLSKAIWKED